MADELSIGEAVEGFHLAALVRGLDEVGALDAMMSPTTAADIAEANRVDAHLLHICLDYVAGRTNLVERIGDRYCVTVEWNDYARAFVRQYVGAYGRHSVELAAVLRDPSVGPALVDHDEQARSQSRAPTASSLVADLVLQLDLAPTLDLGCGSASMLVELGRRHPDFVGWGIDASPEMCAAARARIGEMGLGDRITIVQGDAFDAGDIADLPTAEVRSITATSLLNELWDPRQGRPSVTTWLRSMAATFPGRALVVADYFGRLGQTPPPWPAKTALHDLVQALSGQGIPPPDHDAWRSAYREACIPLLHMIEDDDKSFFIHLLRLPGEP
jgi:SAM-dependent methyltransferase